jgi:hypothetical protein
VVCGLWFVVCGLWFVVCGLWFVVCGLWFVVCGLWFVVCGLWLFITRLATNSDLVNIPCFGFLCQGIFPLPFDFDIADSLFNIRYSCISVFPFSFLIFHSSFLIYAFSADALAKMGLVSRCLFVFAFSLLH